MNAEELIALNDEIAGMARAGLPLDQGLAALAKEMGRGRLRSVTGAIATDLRSGLTLPEALERQAGRVPPFYAGLVAAGVRTGRIADVLATVTTYARSVATLRTTILDALSYPCIVLVFGLALFGFLFSYVMPQFDLIYRDFGFRLPWLSEVVFRAGSEWFRYLLLPLVALVLLVVVLKIAMRFTRAGRLLWAKLLYSVPVVGTMLRASRLAAFAELLAILVEHEVPLPEAFRLAGEASSDPVMADLARQIEKDLAGGEPLAKALRGRGLVPEWVSWMTGLGERRGKLGDTLRQVATMYRRQVEMRASLLKSVLPPFFIIAIAGLFVFLFVFVMMLPMIRLMDGLMR